MHMMMHMINVIPVSSHIQRNKVLYLLAFCSADKADVFGNIYTASICSYPQGGYKVILQWHEIWNVSG